MSLCANRPEAFGPKSRIHSSLPTTCFDDVVLVPLATWVFLLVTVTVLIPLSIRALRSKPKTGAIGRFRASDSFYDKGTPVDRNSTIALDYKPDAFINASQAQTRSRPSKKMRRVGLACAMLYFFLILAMLAMISLEIARQVTANIGIGLLPFNYVGVLGAFFVHVFVHTKMSRLVSSLFWLLFAIFMAIKVATYSLESDAGFKRAQSFQGVPLDMYKVSDQITDDATMVGVSVVLLMLECVGLWGLEDR